MPALHAIIVNIVHKTVEHAEFAAQALKARVVKILAITIQHLLQPVLSGSGLELVIFLKKERTKINYKKRTHPKARSSNVHFKLMRSLFRIRISKSGMQLF